MKAASRPKAASSGPRGPQITFKAKLWLWEGKAAWHFATLPKGESAKIKAVFGSMKQGWGSLPVLVTMGQAQWKTSIFPDTKRGAYLLPIKAEVRRMENAKAGDTRTIMIELQL